MTTETWQNLMAAFGIGPNVQTYTELVTVYSETHRAYHTFTHIKTCLQHFDTVEKNATHPDEIRMALWFHDAVYQPFSATNEEDSAAWAVAFLEANEVAPEIITRVHALIMTTKSHDPQMPGDQHLIMDIDLSILGANPVIYAQFEKDIRTEYELVPDDIYKPERRKILEGFLGRPRLFINPHFFNALEQQARVNLAEAVGKLN